MARMLGRWLTGGCHCRPRDNRTWGLDCAGHESDPRRFKRIEQRELEREVAEDLADCAAAREARASIGAGEAVTPWEQVKAEARDSRPASMLQPVTFGGDDEARRVTVRPVSEDEDVW